MDPEALMKILIVVLLSNSVLFSFENVQNIYHINRLIVY